MTKHKQEEKRRGGQHMCQNGNRGQVEGEGRQSPGGVQRYLLGAVGRPQLG